MNDCCHDFEALGGPVGKPELKFLPDRDELSFCSSDDLGSFMCRASASLPAHQGGM